MKAALCMAARQIIKYQTETSGSTCIYCHYTVADSEPAKRLDDSANYLTKISMYGRRIWKEENENTKEKMVSGTKTNYQQEDKLDVQDDDELSKADNWTSRMMLKHQKCNGLQ